MFSIRYDFTAFMIFVDQRSDEPEVRSYILMLSYLWSVNLRDFFASVKNLLCSILDPLSLLTLLYLCYSFKDNKLI